MPVPQYDSLTALKVLNAIVSVTRFNKGEAGKIIEEVKEDGIRVVVKNNVPECVMITVDKYQELIDAAKRPAGLIQSKEEDEKRKEFIKKIRQNVQPPMPPTISVAEALERYGSEPINIDEDAVNELRRISTL